jgi:hypothetical protein
MRCDTGYAILGEDLFMAFSEQHPVSAHSPHESLKRKLHTNVKVFSGEDS